MTTSDSTQTCPRCKGPISEDDETRPWGRALAHATCVQTYYREHTARYRARKGQLPKPELRIDDDGRECSKCGEYKPWDEYYTDPSGAHGRSSICKDDRRARRRETWATDHNGHRTKDFERRAARTPEEIETFLHGQFVYRLKRDFHMTEQQYDEMFERQNGVCALCLKPETKIGQLSQKPQRLSVDHDHRCCPESAKFCGKCVRALLCSACNQLVGHVENRELESLIVAYFSKGLTDVTQSD